MNPMKTALATTIFICSAAFVAAQPLPPAGAQIVNGRAIIEGDIDVGPAEALGQPLHRDSLYTSSPQLRWTNATIPYIIDADIPQPERITSGMLPWTSATPIKFVPRTSESNYVHFMRQTGGICNSSVGMVGGEQFIHVEDTCNALTLTHEMGHTIGLLHEQSRPDRNYYMNVHLENMDKRYTGNSLLNTGPTTHAGFFDYGSIMEYTPYEETKATQKLVIETIPPGIPIDGSAHGPSAEDIDTVRRIYGDVPTSVTITSDPEGLHVIVDGAAVTTPQSFNWAAGSVHTLDVSDLQGDGTPVRYLFGRWGDNKPKKHSITVSPNTTVYSAFLIRQYLVKTGVSPSDGGAVTISPASSDGYYTDNAPVTITATPRAGYTFSGWNGTGSFTFITVHGLAVSPASFLVTIPNLVYVAHFTQSPVLTITTDPPDLPVTVNGNRASGPRAVAVNPGGTVQVSADATVTFSIGATRYVFQGWSDGGAAAHTVTAPASGNYPVITAKYKLQQLVGIGFSGRGSVTLAPASTDGFYDDGSTVQVTAVPANGFQLAGWNGDLSGTALSQTITVNDQVAASAGFQQPFAITGIVNAASFVSVPVSPGEIVTIFGLSIGAPTLTTLVLDSAGNVATALAGTRVLFDGIAAPIVYTSANQIAAIVPYEVAGKPSTSIQVELNGQRTPATFLVSGAAPGIFTLNSSGRGLGAILNEDNSVNSATNPARKGSVVVLFVTGEGQTIPAGVDGKVAGSSPLPKPSATITAHLGGPPGIGTDAQVQYAGAAPGLVAGVMQINLVIPPDAPSGNVPLYFSAGNANSIDMTAVAIQD